MDRRAFVGLAGAAALHRITRSLVRREPRFVERWSWAMGQSVHIQLYATSEGHGLTAAAAALAELRRVEDRLSLFDDASDISELNRHAGRGTFRAAPDLAHVLSVAERSRLNTGGAFNVAVEPLMRAWGFRDNRATAPTSRELAEAREAVRTATVRIDGDRISLPNAHTRLDLGGIGVGYGLDRMAAVLRNQGIASALMDVSGDMIAIGAPPGAPGWHVAVARSARSSAPRETRWLRDEALATSANSVQVRRYGALTVGHVMDPATGIAARGNQVTVVSTRAILADVLSTAALVGAALRGRP